MHVKDGARSRGLNVGSRVLDVGAQNNIPDDLIYESRPWKSEEESTTVYQRSSLSVGQSDTECRKRKERVSPLLRSTSGHILDARADTKNAERELVREAKEKGEYQVEGWIPRKQTHREVVVPVRRKRQSR